MEWIKVEDRLPEEGDYLVSDGINVTCGYFDNYGVWNASYAKPTYEISNVYLDLVVLYYAKLPEPPKQ